jgi:hypothetical protein
MNRKRHADLPLEGGRGFMARATYMKQIGDLEGETLAAVRAACQRCHLPLPATCLAYSLFQAASKSDAKPPYTINVNKTAMYMQAFKDREAEQIQTEICSKLRTHQGGNKESIHPSTSRFGALVQLHASSAGQIIQRAARPLLYCNPQPPAMGWWRRTTHPTG